MTQFSAKVQKPYFWAYLGLYYCPTLHPFLGMKEWRLSTPIWKYISPAIQIWNQIFKIFSSCFGFGHLKNVTVKTIFGPLFPFFRKMRIFLKNGVWGSLYPLMPSNFMHNMKKYNEPISNNIQKSWFFPTAPPIFGPFCPKSRERIFQDMGFAQKVSQP